MDKKYILIIFNTNKAITKEVIDNAYGLRYNFCDIMTIDDVLSNKQCLLEYKAVIDCTDNYVFYNGQKSMKNGVEFTDNNIQYIKTSTNKFISTGPNISRLTATQFNQSKQVMEQFTKDYNDYLIVINFMIKKIPEIRNINIFDNAMKTEGLILDFEVKNNFNKKQYKLVKKVPETKEQNTEYVTYDDIFILNELKNIIDFIK